MAFLQKKLFYPAKFPPPLLKQGEKGSYKFKNQKGFMIFGFLNTDKVFKPYKFNHQKGFMTLLLLPFLTLMITGIIGLTALSVGIKNITQSQSICIKHNIKRQKELGSLLKQMLSLNKQATALHKTRKALKVKLTLAISTGQFQLVSPLRKALSLIKKGQKTLIQQQKYLLSQSQIVKIKTFQKLKRTLEKLPVSKVREKNPFHKALALEKKKIGDKAYNYKPVANFTKKQHSRYLWKINPFYPLDISWLKLKHKKVLYQCATSLTKKGNLWISHLYH